MKFKQKSASIFPYLKFAFCFHFTRIFISNMFQTSAFCPSSVFLTSPRGCIRHAVFICSSHRDTYIQFTISYWLLFVRSFLSVFIYQWNNLQWKWVTFYPGRNCNQLPSSWSGVTSFRVETLNCHISRIRSTRIPAFLLNLDLVTTILYTKIHAISSSGTLRIWPVFMSFDRAAAAQGRR